MKDGGPFILEASYRLVTNSLLQAKIDDFVTIKKRSHIQFDTMPKTLMSETNHNYPASDRIINDRKKLLAKYAPDKNINAY